MSWIAAGTTAVGLIGTYMGNKGADKAADAQERANQASIAEQRRQFDLTRQDQQPWMQAGQGALEKQNQFLAGDWSGFQNSPDYKWATDQGLKALDRSAAAGGMLTSGGADADRIAFGQGHALQNSDSYWNKLADLSGTGQVTASGLGSLGMGMANSIGSLNQASGQARASSYLQKADNNQQLAAGIGGQFNNWYQQRPPSNAPVTGLSGLQTTTDWTTLTGGRR